uniref:Uncharacterized protein n=1 Tax=Anguilla anguilla TaxID=7936 RepID=A0A0E9W3W9_ANGAN
MEVYLGNASGNNVQCIRVTVMPLAEENKTKQMTPGCFVLLCFFCPRYDGQEYSICPLMRAQVFCQNCGYQLFCCHCAFRVFLTVQLNITDCVYAALSKRRA